MVRDVADVYHLRPNFLRSVLQISVRKNSALEDALRQQLQEDEADSPAVRRRLLREALIQRQSRLRMTFPV